MRTIETTAEVTAGHRMTIAVPDDIPPGPCRVVVVVDAPAAHQPTPDTPPSRWADWPAHDVELVDPNCTFRREDLYDGER